MLRISNTRQTNNNFTLIFKFLNTFAVKTNFKSYLNSQPKMNIGAKLIHLTAISPLKNNTPIPNFSLLQTHQIKMTKTHKTKQQNPTKSKPSSNKQYWLLKTEPEEWSWEDQSSNGGISNWDGVKNKQALKYLRSMNSGDLCFFYHSGPKARRVVGVVSVIKECYSDDGGGRVAVDVAEVGEFRRHVDLGLMKEDERLKAVGFALFRQPRLSVVPVSAEVWERVCELGGGYEGDDVGGENG